MTEGTRQLSEREEIEMLVPFYVTGSISSQDAGRVESYLKRNPDFAEHIELAREERAASVAVNEALGFPSARASDAIFKAIAAERPSAMARVREKRRGILAAIGDFFTAPTPGAVRYAALAAVALFLVQAVVLGKMFTGPDVTDGYQTASGPQTTVTPGTVALVAFEDTASLAEIVRLLQTADATIIEGPLQGGLFRIRFAPGNDGAAGVKQKMEALKAKTAVIKSLLPSH